MLFELEYRVLARLMKSEVCVVWGGLPRRFPLYLFIYIYYNIEIVYIILYEI